MKVGLVTTWNEKCGLAEYSRNIVENMPEDVEFTIIGRDKWGDNFSNIPSISYTCDITHIMHQGGLMESMTHSLIKACKKVIITRQCIGDESVFNAALIKTAHVKMYGYRFIPHGIPVVDVSKIEVLDKYIGCAGIPFNGKGHMEAVEMAEKIGWGVNLVIPDNPHTNSDLANHIRQYCKSKNIPCIMHTEWLSELEVIKVLAQSTVNSFYYARWANGISGAVRMGLASLRPTLVSNHSQFVDIIPTGYVGVADSIEIAANLILENKIPNPKPLVDLWGYDKTAMMYYNSYKEIL